MADFEIIKPNDNRQVYLQISYVYKFSTRDSSVCSFQ